MRRWQPLDRYLAAVSAAGFVLLAILLTRIDVTAITHTPITFALFAAFVIAGESKPIRVPHQDQVKGLTITTTFAFAITLEWGVGAGAGVIAVASATSDLARRKPASRVIFNVAQYVLSLGVPGLIWETLAGGQQVTDTLALALAVGLGFAAANHALVAVAVGLAEGRGIPRALADDLGFSAWSSAMLIGIAPVTVIIAHHSPILVPTLLIPVVAVYIASQAAVTAHLRQAESVLATRRAQEIAAEQQRLAQAEQALVRELQEADRVKSRLLAAVSHELRSPLTTILGTLSILEARYDQLQAAQRHELVGMGARQARKLLDLIKQLLLAADLERLRPEAGTGIQLDVAELVEVTATNQAAEHADRVVSVTTAGPLVVLADPGAVSQILTNLIENACKFSPPERPVRVSATRAGSLAVIAVEDAGSGIPNADRHRVFDRFTQLAEPDGHTGGFGLGLYIARQLAREQGGDLVAGDALHLGGARLELRLPLRKASSTRRAS